MEESKLKWGIIGAGIIAQKMIDALRQNRDSELIAIASKSAEKAAIFAERNRVPISCSYDEIVNNNDIDVIYVATTHNFHFENVKLAMEHGKHVLVEKAFTVNGEEAEELAAIAKGNNLFLMEAIWVRFLPSYKLLKKKLTEGIVGDVKQINITFGRFIPPKYEKRLNDPDLAGGVTLDMGIYPISFICFLLGELPSEVKATSVFSSSGVDMTADYLFKFPSGALASINTSYGLYLNNNATLYGSKGYIDFPDFQEGESFTAHIHNGTNTPEPGILISEKNNSNGFIYQVKEVVRCIRNGETESPVIPHQETIGIMKIMDKIRDQWGFKYPFEE